MLSEAKKQANLKAGCCVCPYCGSADTHTCPVEWEDGNFIVEGKCSSCKKTWHVVYEPVDIVESDFEEQSKPASADAPTEPAPVDDAAKNMQMRIDDYQKACEEAGIPAELPTPDRTCKDRRYHLLVEIEGGCLAYVSCDLSADLVDLVVIDHDPIKCGDADDLLQYGQDLAEMKDILPHVPELIY